MDDYFYFSTDFKIMILLTPLQQLWWRATLFRFAHDFLSFTMSFLYAPVVISGAYRPSAPNSLRVFDALNDLSNIICVF